MNGKVSIIVLFALLSHTIGAGELVSEANLSLSKEMTIRDSFERRLELSRKEQAKFVKLLENSHREGNIESSVMLASINLEKLAFIEMCIPSNSCISKATQQQKEKLLEDAFNLLSKATDNGKGNYELALLFSVVDTKYYSIKKYKKHLLIAAEKNDVRAIDFLVEAYNYGDINFSIDRGKVEYYMNKLEKLTSLKN